MGMYPGGVADWRDCDGTPKRRPQIPSVPEVVVCDIAHKVS
jgi:hypothetical protein